MIFEQLKLFFLNLFEHTKKNLDLTIPYSKIILLITIIALLFSVTNFVPFSAILILLVFLIPLLLIISLLKDQTISIAYVFSSLMLLYFLIDLLIYDKEALVTFDFFRRDGNVFITFAPLMILSLLFLKIKPEQLIKKFIIYATLINFIIFILWKAKILLVKPDYHFLFIAHNAAGGYIASLLSILTGYLLKSKENKKFWLTLFLFNILTLFLTYSRGSILAFSASFITFGFMGKFLRRISIAFIFITHIAVVLWAFSAADPQSYMHQSSYETDLIDVEFYRAGNVIQRLFTGWPRAIYIFTKSPIVGIGYGGYNDTPYILEKIAPMVSRNLNSIRLYNSAHAHHSFLHIMAENGLIGLILFLLCLWSIDRTIRNLPYPEVSLGLRICHWTAIFASLTEHRYFTPSQMLPFFICLGIVIASRNGLKEIQKNEKNLY